MSQGKDFNDFVIDSYEDLKFPSHLGFEDLKKAELLSGQDINEKPNIVLLLQFENNLYSFSLTTKAHSGVQGASRAPLQDLGSLWPVFDQYDEAMMPRYMIGNHTNNEHVYCAVCQMSTQKVVKVSLNAEHPGQVQINDVFVLHAGMIAALEVDPENMKYFYLIDDYQNVF